MATITCTARNFYENGSAISETTLVGRQSASYNNVVRYTFSTASIAAGANSVAVSFNGLHAGGGVGTPANLRFKITTSTTSHVNANANSSYDGEVLMTYNGGYRYPSIPATSLVLLPKTTYYLYIFTGSTVQCYYYWDSITYSNVKLTTSGGAGIVYIDNESSFDAYQAYIDNGSSWDLHMPYIDNGTGWDLYS